MAISKQWVYSSSAVFLLGCGAASLNYEEETDAIVHHPTAEYYLPYEHGTRHQVWRAYGGVSTHVNKYAVDFKVRPGTKILAARSGTIPLSGGYADNRILNCIEAKDLVPRPHCDDEGNFIKIEHDDGITTGVYYHLQTNGVCVTPGQYVNRGDVIGLSGDTGNSTGPHIHFEVQGLSYSGPNAGPAFADISMNAGVPVAPYDASTGGTIYSYTSSNVEGTDWCDVNGIEIPVQVNNKQPLHTYPNQIRLSNATPDKYDDGVLSVGWDKDSPIEFELYHYTENWVEGRMSSWIFVSLGGAKYEIWNYFTDGILQEIPGIAGASGTVVQGDFQQGDIPTEWYVVTFSPVYSYRNYVIQSASTGKYLAVENGNLVMSDENFTWQIDPVDYIFNRRYPWPNGAPQ